MPIVVETPEALKDLIGREILTDWFAMTPDHIERFAEITEDRQWIHVDRERAQLESPYRTTIAHGFLTLSLLSHFLEQAIQVLSGVRLCVNYGLNRVRFPSPVPSGSKIRAHFTLGSLRELHDAVEVVFHTTLESQNADKPCCVAEWVVRYYT